MKSEREIRLYRDGLRAALARPCDCAETGHEAECFVGGEQIKANLMLLDWLLGEAPDHDRMAEMLVDLGRRARVGG